MAKRYHSEFLNETSGQCNLPENVIVKNISKNSGSEQDVKDLYKFVESQFATDHSDLRKVTNPKKF